MISDEEIESAILYKLFLRKCWGGKHTSFDNSKKGFKEKELGKTGLKRINEMGKKLIRNGLLIPKPTHYGSEVSLNYNEKEEIMKKIQKLNL